MSLVNYLLVGLLGAMLGIALYTSKMTLSRVGPPEISVQTRGTA